VKPIDWTVLRTGAYSAVFTLALFGPAFAQARPSQLNQDPSTSAVAVVAMHACTQEVRTAVPRSDFDAYVGQSGTFRLHGNEQEGLLFRACMRQKGYPAASK